MQRIYYLLLGLFMSSFVQAQDCEKAWMHYERRVELSQRTAQEFGVEVPIEKIQIDFLGAPVGIPFNYTTKEYSPYSDHQRLEKDGNLLLHKEANRSLEDLKAIAQQVGIELKLNNTYRSYSEQKHLHDKLGGHQAEKPGYSEHHLCTAIDLKNVNNKKFRWLLQNAFAFGWVPSYYFREGTKIKKEPWHWRYVGTLAAKKFRCAWELEINRCIWKLR
jgi:LAS superfamily LD-carboxypeptidase LdcB